MSSTNWIKDEFIEQTVSILGDLPKVKIAEGLTSAEAGHLETLLIAAIGRWPDGPLTNIADGGQGTSGYCDRPEVRTRVAREAAARWNDPEYREMMRSPEIAEKRTNGIRASRKRPEYLERVSEARKEAWARDRQLWWTNGVEERRLGPAAEVPDGWWRGRSSHSNRGQKKTPEQVAVLRENRRGRIWITDGKTTRLTRVTVLPRGWRRGRIGWRVNTRS